MKGDEKRGLGGAGGSGGIGGRARTQKGGEGKAKRNLLGPSPCPNKKDLEKVQSRQVCLRGKAGCMREEMHGRCGKGLVGHLSRVERRTEVL